jgi:hypothetical protein
MYIAVLNNWPTMQLDFVLAFPQAQAETDIFMQITQGFSLQGGNKRLLPIITQKSTIYIVKNKLVGCGINT